MNRLYSLDYLRGFAALIIVFYHFHSWSGGAHDTSVLNRCGLYGVSVFYVLSGLTLYFVYNSRLSLANIGNFFAKRVLRIYPLLWLATTITIIGAAKDFSFYRIFLNYTGIFSFVDPRAYIAGGAWSIGNELVFYLFFPVLIYFSNKRVLLLHISALLSIALLIYFAFIRLNASENLINQWTGYINPLNQIFFFIAGIYIGKYKAILTFGRTTTILIFVGAVLGFCLYPVSGGKSSLITDMARMFFSFICLALTISVFNMNKIENEILHKVLSWIGDISYTIYLLHPILWAVSGKVMKILGYQALSLKVALAITLTLLVSTLVYKYYEKKVVVFGNKLLSRD